MLRQSAKNEKAEEETKNIECVSVQRAWDLAVWRRVFRLTTFGPRYVCRQMSRRLEGRRRIWEAN